MIECPRVVEGCQQCVEQAERWGDHHCGELCEMMGESKTRSAEFHQKSHEPMRCDKCRVVVRDQFGKSFLKRRLCQARLCTIWACPKCGHEWASEGPVDCPIDGSDDGVIKIRLKKMHGTYRARRR